VPALPTGISSTAISRAQKLRRNMTDGEKRLWSELKEFRRHYGLHVRKQAPIGPYIVDFAVHARNLVIEVDGEHHFTPDGMKRDARRDQWLRGQGYRVIRFTTGDLGAAFDGCITELLRELGLMETAQ
jgi:very-short-patch-repair endonuclease